MSIEYPCVHFEKGLCKLFTDDKTISYCLRGPCKQQQLSNADRIRAMSDDELAEFLESTHSQMAIKLGGEYIVRAKEYIGIWLKQPAEVTDNERT